MEIAARERLLEDEQRRRQKEYRDMLQAQIKNAQQRRLFEGVMSEHERRVNERDIEAYENMDTTVHSKVVGVKAPEEVDARFSPGKRTRKSTQENLSSVQGADSKDSKAGSLYPSEQPYIASPLEYQAELARKLNGGDILSHRRLRADSGATPGRTPSRLAEIAAKNMDSPNLRIMRSNTRNSSYGYYNSGGGNKPAPPQDDYGVLGSNKSFICSQRPLADAGKGLLSSNKSMLQADAQTGDTTIPVLKMSAKRGISLESRAHRRSEYRTIDLARMRPAGSSRRQVIGYNIITGIGK